eukprot:TRINITY_DN9897_c0_g1_i3.p1 TRINITY_DN9897_c0_g1~~TRINITY_DN9897_c0_g1_i3.p1  ORF type:complete len:376 (+),score=104.30 TRINITY_DN9897_c0_g1_i3:101-1228(+)
MLRSLVGSEMCIRDSINAEYGGRVTAAMHRQIYPLPWDVKKRQEVHRKRLKNTKHQIDTQCPAPQPHLVTKAKKHELEEDRYAEIERENAVLLAKMSKIMREGAGTHDQGGAPPAHEIRPTAPKSLNRGFRRKELDKITRENLEILKRIQLKDPFYNHLDWDEEHKARHKIMKSLCEVKPVAGSRFVSNLRNSARAGNSGALTARSSGQNTTRRRAGRRPDKTGAVTAREGTGSTGLQRVRVDDIKLLLGMRRPPELVKKVFSSLMLLVSPFNTTDEDISWEAVQNWLGQLKGVESFVKNLNHFDVTSVDPQVIARTVDYLIQHHLVADQVSLFSAALSSLCSWIWDVCERSVPGVTAARSTECPWCSSVGCQVN